MQQWFHPAFETDLIAAAQRLGQQRAGFDRVFLDEAEQAIETTMQSPATWRPWHGDIRRFLLSRFRYIIRYRIRADEDLVEFLSIVHTSRHPHTDLDR